MKLVAGRKVCWKDDAGGHHVGVELAHETSGNFVNEVAANSQNRWVSLRLIRHAHTAELEFVPVGALRDYPQSPIPEPGQGEPIPS